MAPDELGRGRPDPGRRAVVGVAVDALLVVVHQGVGALGVGELGDAAGQLEGVPRGQRPAVGAAGPTGQAGVAVAEQHQAGHPEHPGDLLQLGAAAPPDRLAAAQRDAGAAEGAVGGDDEDGARAGVGEPAQRQTHEDRLVVGVGVQGQDGVAPQVGDNGGVGGAGAHEVIADSCGPREAAETDGAGGQLWL